MWLGNVACWMCVKYVHPEWISDGFFLPAYICDPRMSHVSNNEQCMDPFIPLLARDTWRQADVWYHIKIGHTHGPQLPNHNYVTLRNVSKLVHTTYLLIVIQVSIFIFFSTYQLISYWDSGDRMRAGNTITRCAGYASVLTVFDCLDHQS